jgi:kelch-like protein 1/4/5
MVGGFNAAAGGRLKTLYSYNPATDTWTMLPSLAVGKSQSALGVFGQTIVAGVGLLENSSATTDNEGYNVITNTWTTLAPLPPSAPRRMLRVRR